MVVGLAFYCHPVLGSTCFHPEMVSISLIPSLETWNHLQVSTCTAVSLLLVMEIGKSERCADQMEERSG